MLRRDEIRARSTGRHDHDHDHDHDRKNTVESSIATDTQSSF